MRISRMVLGLCVGFFLVWGWAQSSGCGPVPGEEKKAEGSGQDGGAKDGVSPADASPQDRQPGDSAANDAGPSDASPQESPPETPKEGDSPDVIFKPEILTPNSFAPIQLQTTQFTLPKALANESQLHFAIHAGLTTLLGGKTGLYRIDQDNIVRVDKTAVVGLAAWQGSKVVVAHAKQLGLWDGKVLAPTKFFQSLDGSNIKALTERDKDSFWIGTAKGLWLYDKEQLRQFTEVKGVQSLVYAPKKQLLVVQDAAGKHHALQEKTAGQWVLRSFDGEGVSLQVLLSHFDAKKVDFWGMDGKNGLMLRKSTTDGQAAWWLFRLKPDKDDKETLKLTQLLYQHKSEHTWALTTGDFHRLTEGVARTLSRPAKLGPLKTANSTSDGALWLSDGKSLFRFGEAIAATSYKKDIEPIVQRSCISCHKPGGRASFRPFQTYNQVKAASALILERIDVKKNMPPGKPLPATDIAKFKSWIAGGRQP